MYSQVPEPVFSTTAPNCPRFCSISMDLPARTTCSSTGIRKDGANQSSPIDIWVRLARTWLSLFCFDLDLDDNVEVCVISELSMVNDASQNVSSRGLAFSFLKIPWGSDSTLYLLRNLLQNLIFHNIFFLIYHFILHCRWIHIQ